MRALPRRQQSRSGEAVVEQHPQPTRLLVTIYVASTGIKKTHMRALPRGNNRSGEAAVEQRFPTARSLAMIYIASIGIKRITRVHYQEATIVVGSRCGTTLRSTIARDDLCREYRHQTESGVHY